MAFLGALRHRTRVDVQDVYLEFQADGIHRAGGTNCHGCGSSSSVCVLMAGLSWVPWLLCTTGVQPHPARVQSVWLRPGEAANQPSTLHTPHTPSTGIFHSTADMSQHPSVAERRQHPSCKSEKRRPPRTGARRRSGLHKRKVSQRNQ